jgi:hypothetical protein
MTQSRKIKEANLLRHHPTGISHASTKQHSEENDGGLLLLLVTDANIKMAKRWTIRKLYRVQVCRKEGTEPIASCPYHI